MCNKYKIYAEELMLVKSRLRLINQITHHLQGKDDGYYEMLPYDSDNPDNVIIWANGVASIHINDDDGKPCKLFPLDKYKECMVELRQVKRELSNHLFAKMRNNTMRDFN